MAEYASTHKLLDIPDDVHVSVESWLGDLMSGEGSESPSQIRITLQDEMMDKASVSRDEASLSSVLTTVRSLRERYAKARVKDRNKIYNTELVEHVELGFLIDMAEALVVSARARTESRGGHYRSDHTLREDEHWLKHTFITKTPEGETRLAYKDVTMGRYVPVERKY
jgi:succinate dehydrogenase / fumarate reductase flavoprotein subunit